MRKLWLVLLLGILVAGCGTKGELLSNEPDNKVEAEGSGIVAGEMEASLTEQSPFVFQYEVKNQTEEEMKLEFSSSQRFDYSVQTKDGKEIFLFSSVASFLQVIGEENVKQGESLTYEIDLHDLELQKGDYVLSAWLTPMEGQKYKATKEFTVE
ncbi:MAG: BsuPI-related putative proteinase inhibitor [Bacillota bacterium]